MRYAICHCFSRQKPTEDNFFSDTFDPSQKYWVAHLVLMIGLPTWLAHLVGERSSSLLSLFEKNYIIATWQGIIIWDRKLTFLSNLPKHCFPEIFSRMSETQTVCWRNLRMRQQSHELPSQGRQFWNRNAECIQSIEATCEHITFSLQEEHVLMYI